MLINFGKLYETSTKEGNNMATPWYAYGEAGEQTRDAVDRFVHSETQNILALIYWCERVGMTDAEIVQLLKEEL